MTDMLQGRQTFLEMKQAHLIIKDYGEVTKAVESYGNNLLLSETTGDETLRYYYDNTGEVLISGYIKGNVAENKYFFTRNAQNDIVSVYRSSDSKLIGTYEYDLWGKPVSITESTPGIDTDGILTKNPLRYRSYRYDAETGFYHLKSRYYDPNIRRFISADTVSAVTVEIISTNGDNLFAYCENSPVCFEDSNGQYVETPYDIVTLEMSLMEAAAPEAGFWEWVNVALDAADIAIPLATFPVGAGEICRFIRYACKSPAGKLVTASVGYADEVGDVARHTYRHIDNVGDIAKVGLRSRKISNRLDMEKVYSHVFSKQHISNGIMNLGKDETDILNKFFDIADKTSNLWVEGSNEIRTTINGLEVTIRIYIEEGKLVNLDGFVGYSQRAIGNLINY